MTATARHRLEWFRDHPRAWQIGLPIGLCLMALALWQWKGGRLAADSTGVPAGKSTAAKAQKADAREGPRDIVELNGKKLERAGIKLATAERRPVRETRAVPGHIRYDGARHLEVTAPVDGVVKRVLAEPGQNVPEHEPLVVISSTEVGLARAEVFRNAADLELAQREHDWAEAIALNVADLLKWFGDRPSIESLEERLEERPLGEYREKLVSAYSKLVLAENTAASTTDLTDRGALARRVIEERLSNRDVARATFRGACELARFDSTQAHRKSHANVRHAERLLGVARERLAALLGPQGRVDETRLDEEPAANAVDLEKFNEFQLLAPFGGRIEERQAVIAARVQRGDPLFTLADTKLMWVEAEIHERDWRSLQFASQGPIAIRVPALAEAVFETKLRYVGARVSSVTRSVPLVTELDNSQGLFKPGMFVWVSVPLEEPREALVVPAGAIMRHERLAFVFIPLGGNRYRRLYVETGLDAGSYIEIRTGLEAGQEVVEAGAFFLKSELLLEREAE